MRKEDLIQTSYFIDNEYLDLYLALVSEPFIGTEGEVHHIIPKSYYRIIGVLEGRSRKKHPVVDRDDNLVYLTYLDHIKAHYYLTLCTTGELHKRLCYSFITMIDKNVRTKKLNSLSKEDLMRLFENYDRIKRERNEYDAELARHRTARFDIASYCRNHVWSEDELRRRRDGNSKGAKAKTGRITITNGVNNKFIEPKDLNLWTSKGWFKGFTRKSSPQEMKEKARATRKSNKEKGESYETLVLTNGVNTRRVRKIHREEIQKLKSLGYWEGRTFKKKRVFSSELRKRTSERMRGSKIFYKVIEDRTVLKRFKDEEKALKEGWHPGNPLLSERNKKRRK